MELTQQDQKYYNKWVSLWQSHGHSASCLTKSSVEFSWSHLGQFILLHYQLLDIKFPTIQKFNDYLVKQSDFYRE